MTESIDIPSPGKRRTLLTAGLVLLLAALGFSTLSHFLRDVHMHQIREAFQQIGMTPFAIALALTVASYLVLTLYDVLALRTIGRSVPYGTAALASFTSYTLSHNLGLSVITGGSARYRIYSASGLSVADVARVIALAGMTFWSGVVIVSGLVLAIGPDQTALGGLALSATIWRELGWIILAATLALLLWVGPRGRKVQIGQWTFPLPGRKVVLAQMLVAAVDLACASGALFILVPGLSLSAWPGFFIGYCLALLVTLVSHVPGGVGVFEATMLAALPHVARPELVAALLAYRLIYYLLPLVVAVTFVVMREGAKWHSPLRRTVRGAHQVASGIAPTMISAMVLIGGMVLLISGSLPAIPHRMIWLRDILPLPFVEASHLAASLVGATLVILALGLYRRLDGAVWLARPLLLAGALFSILKGLDYEEAACLLIIAALLQWTRGAFHRHTRLTRDVLSPEWLATVGVLMLLWVWIGFFAYRHVEYDNDLWWQFSTLGDASRFLRATLMVAVLLASLTVWRLLRPLPPAEHGETSLLPPAGEAMALAQRAEANLAYTGDKRFLTSSSGRSFIMYQIRGHSWIAMGDPVGDPAEWSDLLWELREQADAAQGRLLLYEISLEALPYAIDLGLQILKYGEEALIDLSAFSLEGPAARPLRYAARRCEREGALFSIIPVDQVGTIMGELRAISNAWLMGKDNREKGFSVGRFDPTYIARFDCAVLRCNGRIIAFANIWKTQDRSELSVDLMRHAQDVPYGTMDYLFVQLMLWGKQQGYRWFSLGMAPLSGLEARRLAPLWMKLGALLYQHGQNLYGFEGLRSYKDKFCPQWEPRFVAGPQGLAFARALLDLQALIGGRG